MRKNNILNWIKLPSFIFALSSLFASCSNDIDETLQPAGNGAIQFVVSDFPAFGESGLTRAIGTQDEGKTAWADGDKILVHLYSQKYGDQAATLTFGAESNTWESDDASLSYLENETPTITAVYAPDCEIKSDKTIGLLEGKKYGEEEYIPAKTSIRGHILDIRFESGRTYSRLRIAAMPEATLTVTTTDFTPAGANNSSSESGATRAAEEALNVLPCPKEGSTVLCATGARSVPQAEGSVTYTLTADEKGNAYLYGIFAEEATVSVKQGEVTLKDYTFTADKNPNGTEHNKSYALDARPIIDGTLGGKATAEESDITALMEQLKAYVDNGITTITVTGVEPAMYNLLGSDLPAVSAAIFFLGSSGSETNGDPDSPYCGTIDLIMPDATSLAYMEFCSTYALNSVTLPNVTKIADQAFHDTPYLRTITFGSVLTEVNETGGVMFAKVGKEVGGCDLFINCGQMNENSVPAPDLTTNTWKFKFENEFKSITLTHTGECDECKANQ